MKVHAINCQLSPQGEVILTRLKGEHLWINESRGGRGYQAVLKAKAGYWLISEDDIEDVIMAVEELAEEKTGAQKDPNNWPVGLRACIDASREFFNNPPKVRLLKFKRAQNTLSQV